jgi:hypothetical protein
MLRNPTVDDGWIIRETTKKDYMTTESEEMGTKGK